MTNTEEVKGKIEMKRKGCREEKKRINEREATEAQMERSWGKKGQQLTRKRVSLSRKEKEEVEFSSNFKCFK